MILRGWFGKECLQSHFSGDGNPDDFHWSFASDEKCSNLLRRSNSCGEADNLEVSLGDPSQPFDRDGELTAPLVLRQLVYFVNNQEPDFAEVSPHDTSR